MTKMIKVPIGKGITQLLQKPLVPKAPNDLSFLRDLSDEGSLISEFGNTQTPSAIIIPPNGTTFFFLGGWVQNASVTTDTFTLNFDGTTIETVSLEQFQIHHFSSIMVRLVGDGVRQLQVDSTEIGRAYLRGFFVRTDYK